MRGSRGRKASHRRSGFTLVELLVVIGIIALLIGILLPALNRARQSANTIKCASNLRSVGQGMAMYVADNKGVLPPAYIYKGMQIVGNTQTPDSALGGYVHWSSFIYRNKNTNDVTINTPGAYADTTGWDMFQCPTMEKGGLPPTNTLPGNRDSGQVNDDPAPALDMQAPRCAFTVNEALCPRNKFVVGFQGALRIYQFIKAGSVRNSGGTILATEWNQDWHIVADDGRYDPSQTVCKSHRPIHGFRGIAGGELNMDTVGPNPFGNAPTFQKVTVALMSPDPQPGQTMQTRLDWIGRNHGAKKLGKVGGDPRGGWDLRKTNFLYLDGHVETKHVTETVSPWQWGERFYTLSPNADMLP